MSVVQKWTVAAFAALACGPGSGVARAEAPASAPADAGTVLGAGSRWRYHVVLSPPMVSVASAKAAGMGVEPEDRTIRRIADNEHNQTSPVLGVRNPPPPPFPSTWNLPDFDDLNWAGHRGPLRADPLETPWPRELSPECGLIFGRFKFVVNDPSAVKRLLVSVKFRGGLAIYLNGKEVARTALPPGQLEPQTPGDDYPDAATLLDAKTLLHWYRNRDKVEQFKMRDRSLDWTAIEPALLRKGLNVLAVELHRSDYPAACKRLGPRWGANGLTELHLKAQAAPGAIAAAVARPRGIQAWNLDVAERVLDMDFADPSEPLRPMRIVAARNGVLSGAVAVGSAERIDGLAGRVGELKSAGGTIPASAVMVRYGALDKRSVGQKAHGATAYAFDALLEEPPAVVPLAGLGRTDAPHVAQAQAAARAALGLPARPVPGAVVPLWVTVKVPKDASPGDYRGELALSAKGIEPIRVPIEVLVSAWTLPDVRDYACLLNVYQSPDTLALHYKVPLWSKEHWALIEKSVALMGALGNDFIYIPLLSKDQFGNEEAMVYWIREGSAYKHDFSIMDRYLDLFVKHHDPQRLKMIVLVAHGQAAMANEATVTVVEPATGSRSDLVLPPYGTKECEDLWRPLLLAIRERLKARGLDKLMMLGMPCDTEPKPEGVAMFRSILPDVPWMRPCHPDSTSLRYDTKDPRATVPIACVEHVWWSPIPDPAQKRFFGWQLPRMRVSFNRAGYGPLCLLGFCAPWDFRIWLEASLAANDRGAGRVGADFYEEGIRPDKIERGAFERDTGNRGTLFNRYPKSQVFQIGLANNTTDLLPPGPKGPVASVRYENAREGIQAAEAVIFVEKALVEKRVPAELEARAWKLIDERINCLRLHAIDLGSAGWQERCRQLFELASQLPRTTPGPPKP